MITDPGHAAIVRSTIHLAHDLGLTVVAEGNGTGWRSSGATRRRASWSRGRSQVPSLRASCCGGTGALRNARRRERDLNPTAVPGRSGHPHDHTLQPPPKRGMMSA